MKKTWFIVAAISIVMVLFACSKKEEDSKNEEDKTVNANSGTFKAIINGEEWNAMLVSANEGEVGGKKNLNILAVSEKEHFSISILEYRGVGEYQADGFNQAPEVIVVYTDSSEYAYTSFAEAAKCKLKVGSASNENVVGTLEFSGVEKGKNTNRQIEIVGEFDCKKQ